jgi:hypothetical protein
MRDCHFYRAGCDKARGLGKLLLPVRRLLRRILRPMLFRQVELFEGFDHDLERLEGFLESLHGFLVDREALARRLAVLEDRLEALLQERQRQTGTDKQSPRAA